MATSIRGIGTFAAAGILMAILVIGTVAIAGIGIPSLKFPNLPNIPGIATTNSQDNSGSGTGLTSNDGTLAILLTDAPVQLQHLNVTIDKVMVHRDIAGNESGWITLAFVDNKTQVEVDLLTLHNVTTDLSLVQVPVGNYTLIRLGVVSATAVYADGTVQAINVPSDKIDVIVHFEVKAGATTMVIIDMTADFVHISKNGNLAPVLKATATVVPSRS